MIMIDGIWGLGSVVVVVVVGCGLKRLKIFCKMDYVIHSRLPSLSILCKFPSIFNAKGSFSSQLKNHFHEYFSHAQRCVLCLDKTL